MADIAPSPRDSDVDGMIKQMKDDVVQSPPEDKRATHDAHIAAIHNESNKELLQRYGVESGDVENVLSRLKDVIFAKLFPEAAERDTAEEFRADIQQYAAAPPTAPKE